MNIKVLVYKCKDQNIIKLHNLRSCSAKFVMSDRHVERRVTPHRGVEPQPRGDDVTKDVVEVRRMVPRQPLTLRLE